MKVFYYMGNNDENLSGVSWKIWKIERRNRVVTVWWGAAKIDRRKLLAVGNMQQKTWKFRTEDAAKQDEEKRIRQKLSKGYQKNHSAQGVTERRRSSIWARILSQLVGVDDFWGGCCSEFKRKPNTYRAAALCR